MKFKKVNENQHKILFKKITKNFFCSYIHFDDSAVS